MATSHDSATKEINICFKVLRTMALKVKRSDTINNLKTLLRENEGMSENLEEFYFAGSMLRDDQRLVECGIQNNSTLQLFLKDTILIKILIKTPESQKYIVVEARNQETIHSIKSTVRAKEGIRSNIMFNLIHQGAVLEEDKTLESLNIGNDPTLHLVFTRSEVLLIFVKTPSEEFVKLKVKGLFTVHDIKALVGSMTGAAVTDNDAFYLGEKLDDLNTLASYDVTEGSILEIRPSSVQN